eukprot:1195890-Prorocentrum_minimum.AAC.5
MMQTASPRPYPSAAWSKVLQRPSGASMPEEGRRYVPGVRPNRRRGGGGPVKSSNIITQRETQSQEGRQYIPSVRPNRRRGGGIYPARGCGIYPPAAAMVRDVANARHRLAPPTSAAATSPDRIPRHAACAATSEEEL